MTTTATYTTRCDSAVLPIQTIGCIGWSEHAKSKAAARRAAEALRWKLDIRIGTRLLDLCPGCADQWANR